MKKILFIAIILLTASCASISRQDINYVYKLGYWQGATAAFYDYRPDSVQAQYERDSVWFNEYILLEK